MADVTAHELLKPAKQWLRVSAESQDAEIEQTIEAGVLDLSTAGIVVDLSNPLIQQAVKFYLKSHYGNDDGMTAWAEAYEALKGSLSLSAAYTGAGGTADDGSGD